MKCPKCGEEMEHREGVEIGVCRGCKTSIIPKADFYKMIGCDDQGNPPDLSKLSEKELSRKISSIQKDLSYNFHCHIKGKTVTIRDCVRCFEQPSEDGHCYIMNNAVKEMNRRDGRKKGKKAQIKERRERQ